MQPIAIRYSSASAAWIGDDALLPHLWRVLRGPPLTCTLAFGAPIAYVPGADRKAVARAARAAVAAMIESGAVATSGAVASSAASMDALPVPAAGGA